MNSRSPVASSSSATSALTPVSSRTVEGCQKCGKDNDHSYLLLCEACNDEYHTYCLDPPLTSVPEGDFYCSKCKPLLQLFVNDDELDQKVSALAPMYTQRFGEIIWAEGGKGFGWWPACIYDPRLTVGGARKLALKNLGKKHLVYFFGCTEAPFTVLPNIKCMPWNDGLMEEFDVGKVARTGGKNRLTMFEWALQAAIAENDKPIEFRLDWNHEEDPFVVGSALGGTKGRNINVSQTRASTAASTAASAANIGTRNGGNSGDDKKRPLDQNSNGQSEKKRNRHGNPNATVQQPTRRSNRSMKPSSILASIQQQQNEDQKKDKKQQHKSKASASPYTPAKTNRQSMNEALTALHNPNQIEETFDSENDDEFFCKILRKANDIMMDDTNHIQDVNIGFITLSKKSSTFADARIKIHSDFDDDDALFSSSSSSSSSLSYNKKKNAKWKFYIPFLGPMSKKQETKFGSMYDMLTANGDGRVGNGTSRFPLKVIIKEC